MEISLHTINKQDFSLIVKWHKDHAAINFPDSEYKPKLFLISLEEQFNRIGEGEKAAMWIIKFQEQQIGFLWLKLIFDIYKDYHYCDLHYIHLILEFRGQGYGQVLLKIVDNWAKDNGAKEIRLGASFANKQAMRSYRNAGYKIKRVLMEKKLITCG